MCAIVVVHEQIHELRVDGFAMNSLGAAQRLRTFHFYSDDTNRNKRNEQSSKDRELGSKSGSSPRNIDGCRKSSGEGSFYITLSRKMF